MPTVVKPTFDRVLIRPQEPPKQSKIVIPDKAKEPRQEGVVVDVGPGAFRGGVFLAVALKPGDVVFFGEYSGIDLDIEGVKHKILAEQEVLAVIERTSLVMPS